MARFAPRRDERVDGVGTPSADSYKMMTLIRATEERLLNLHAEGVLNGTVHTGIGQEAIAVGVVGALNPEIDVVLSNHRCHGHFLAFGGPLTGLIAEILGRTSGVCGGRGGSQHLHVDRFYSNGILGGMVPVAVGTALAAKLAERPGISCVFFGDGALGQGVVYESLNIAALWKLPVLFVVEDNGYAQTTPKRYSMSGSIADRIRAFGIATRLVPDGDVQEIRSAAQEEIAAIRRERGPRCLVFETYRLSPHSKGDDTRDPEELRLAWSRDPLKRIATQLGPVADRLDAEARLMIDSAVVEALASEEPAGWGAAITQLLPCSFDIPGWSSAKRVLDRLNQGLIAAFEQNSAVILMGEDVLDPYGGAFKVTRGLSSRFPDRVLTTPVSEPAIVGIGTGVALSGQRPIVELMFGDFLTLAIDQLLNHASKMRWMYGGNVSVPLLVRTPMGGRRGYGPTHSQSIERLCFGMPGLRVVAVTRYADPAATLLTCLSQNDPILLIENKTAYSQPVEVDCPEFERVLAPGPLPVVQLRRGARQDITLLTYGGMDHLVVSAALELRAEEIEADVLIAQELWPMEELMSRVAASVSQTRRLVICEEGSEPWGFGAEVIARLSSLDGDRPTIRRVAAATVPIGSSKRLESLALPSVQSILDASTELLG